MLVKISLYVFVTKAGVGPCGNFGTGKKDNKTHIHRHTLTDACTHLLTHSQMQVQMHTLTHRCMHTCSHLLTDACTHSLTELLTHRYMHTLTHRCMHTCTHSLTHRCMYTHTHTHSLTHSVKERKDEDTENEKMLQFFSLHCLFVFAFRLLNVNVCCHSYPAVCVTKNMHSCAAS